MDVSPTQQMLYPNGLPLLRLRLTYRMQQSGALPAFKGSMFRGGFGYAFQRTTCPERCWGNTRICQEQLLCPYQAVFESPRPPQAEHFHDLQDIPRPFVIDLPHDPRTLIEAGDSLEFGLTLIGNGISYLAYFLYSFARLGEIGLGGQRLQAILERVVALAAGEVQGESIYEQGIFQAAHGQYPLIQDADILAQAERLPSRLNMGIRVPLRLKSGGKMLAQLDLPALIRAIIWRLSVLDAFHGAGSWPVDYQSLSDMAHLVELQQQTRWEELERISDHRGPRERISLGGIVGQIQLNDVPAQLRAILLAGQLIHVGKSCVFGTGTYRLG